MQKIGSISAFKRRQNIILQGFDPISAGGFTQVPNHLLNDSKLSFPAKVIYSKLLSYAWNNNLVFPGQERMGEEIGTSQPTIHRAIQELEKAGWLEVKRRGQGKTNIYILKFVVGSRRG